MSRVNDQLQRRNLALSLKCWCSPMSRAHGCRDLCPRQAARARPAPLLCPGCSQAPAASQGTASVRQKLPLPRLRVSASRVTPLPYLLPIL